MSTTDLGEGIVLLAGSLPASQIDSISKTHFYQNISVTISAQTFVPLALMPNAVLVRCRRGLSSSPYGAIQCRVFDSTGNPVPVVNPNISLQNVPNFSNQKFQINGATANFPAFGLWTVEIDVVNTDLAGIVRCYAPSFPFILNKETTEIGCSTTVVIS